MPGWFECNGLLFLRRCSCIKVTQQNQTTELLSKEKWCRHIWSTSFAPDYSAAVKVHQNVTIMITKDHDW